MWRRFPVGLRSWLGIEIGPISHAERIVSAVGGFLGIFFILLGSWAVLGDREATLLIVGSMGASAVLVFGVPHGPLSQPWALVGGHAISAVIGVASAQLVGDPFVAAALAVGGAIGAMHYLRCIHPPGGATAITAVIGGPAIHALGYRFLVTPVLLNVAIILTTAIAVNGCFAWRRYPASLARRSKPEPELRTRPRREGQIAHTDLEYALHEFDSLVDVTENDLARIYRLAAEHARAAHPEPWQIKRHRFYSNGRYGAEWSIREVLDDWPHDDPLRDTIAWRAVDGDRQPREGTCTRAEFARWARHEVFRERGAWTRGKPDGMRSGTLLASVQPGTGTLQE
jgi:CBS domain-containing membrane protein